MAGLWFVFAEHPIKATLVTILLLAAFFMLMPSKSSHEAELRRSQLTELQDALDAYATSNGGQYLLREMNFLDLRRELRKELPGNLDLASNGHTVRYVPLEDGYSYYLEMVNGSGSGSFITPSRGPQELTAKTNRHLNGR